MSFKANTYNALGMSSAIALVALASPASAEVQAGVPLTEEEVQSLPIEYRTGPVIEDVTETIVSADGVETITRTRRIEQVSPSVSIPYPHHAAAVNYAPAYGYAPAGGYAPAASVFQRDQWIDECERRTRDRDDDDKGGIIGGLLGAIAGGIIGNRVADGDRLAGTLIGGGLGGIGGVLLGSLIGGGRDDDGEYDCEAALDSYLSQHGYPGVVPVTRIAARSIPTPAYPAPAYAPYPAYGYGYGYGPVYQSYGYSYAPPQQIVYVPIQYEQQQRVIVRETIREETYEVPGAAREIPPPPPTPAPQPEPIPVKYIKGN